jgi:hypothetical protein
MTDFTNRRRHFASAGALLAGRDERTILRSSVESTLAESRGTSRATITPSACSMKRRTSSNPGGSVHWANVIAGLISRMQDVATDRIGVRGTWASVKDGARFCGTENRSPRLSTGASRTISCSVADAAIPSQDAAIPGAELHRILKPGGRFAVIENLNGSPVALAYRALRRASGERYRATLTPRNHLKWSDRGQFAGWFPDVRFRVYDLMAPLLLLADPIACAPADTPAEHWTRRCIETVGRLDDALFRRIPGARRAAWLLLATGARR